MATTTEEIYNLSRVYSKMRKGEMETREVVFLTKKALNTKNFEAIEKLSNIVFARGNEEEKLDLARSLKNKGYNELIPLHYRKLLKNI